MKLPKIKANHAQHLDKNIQQNMPEQQAHTYKHTNAWKQISCTDKYGIFELEMKQ